MSKYVYLVADGKHQKIGIAASVKSRLSSLQVGNPNELTLIAEYFTKKRSASQIEKVLHEKYKDNWKLGEWFEMNITASEFEVTCKEADEGRVYFGDVVGTTCVVCKSPADGYDTQKEGLYPMYLGQHHVCSDGCLHEFLIG